jgi:hypothetical protein
VYEAAYEAAKRLKGDGKPDEKIRKELSCKEDKQAYSAEDSAGAMLCIGKACWVAVHGLNLSGPPAAVKY